MTDRHPVGSSPALNIEIPGGDVVVREGPPGTIDVSVDGRGADEVEIDQVGDRVEVRRAKGRGWLSRRSNIEASVPPGCRITGKIGTGDVVVGVPDALLDLAVGAGEIRIVAEVAGSRLRAGAGDVTVGAAAGPLRIASGAGDVTVGVVDGDLDVASGAGDVQVGTVHGTLSLRAASGDLSVDRLSGPMVEARTLSGDIRIGIPAGWELEVDLQTRSGSVLNRLGAPIAERRGSARLRLKTTSGDIVLLPVEA